jgi:CheY-like chemotaxis protein
MPKVLVVDDEASVRSSLRKLLERGGFVVREAASGRAALETIAGEPIDAVVSDFLMPELNGIEFYDQLVALVPHLQRRVIFLTGAAGDSSVHVPLEQRGVPLIHKLDDPQLVVDAVRLLTLKKS